MKHLFTLTVVLTTFLSMTHADDKTQDRLADLNLDLKRLGIPQEQNFTYQAKAPDGQGVVGTGTVRIVTEVKDDNVILTDEMHFTYRGTNLSQTLIHRCRKDNFLSPLRIESMGKGDDELNTFVATIHDGKAVIEVDGKKQTMELPPQTVTFSALFRILPLLPRENGTRISFPYCLESSELNLKKDFEIECLGEEDIMRDDQSLTCTKYRITSRQIMPLDAWVDSDGILQRMTLDGRKTFDLSRPK